jgi:hypothetical protein
MSTVSVSPQKPTQIKVLSITVSSHVLAMFLLI